MRLADLAGALPGARIEGNAAVEVTDLTYDSRAVAPGSLFVALRGVYTDGHAYVAAAARGGAVAALVEEVVPAPELAAQIVTPDTRAALARVAAAFFGHPSREIGVIGVTGTDGKTTTTYFINAMLETAGLGTGLIGTVDIKLGPDWLGNPSRQTTPESLDIQRLLRRMAAAGLDWAIVESTSHGLAMHRLDSVAYDVAVMTNVTHEHLDFHKTFENYREAKATLFRFLSQRPAKTQPRVAVINADDPSCDYFVAAAGEEARVLRYGLSAAEAEIRATAIDLRPEGTRCAVETPAGQVDLTLQTIGDFNIANALAALGVGIGIGLPLDQIAAGLASLTGVPGRLERIALGQPFLMVVDYAHTPDSLAKMLRLLRPLTSGRLIAVFGSAGERDVAKRAIQGRVSQELADISVLTSEDPRFEDAAAIVRQIAAGALEAGGREGVDVFQEPDRMAAVHLAVGMARPGDTVLLAGKGHEQSIIVGAEKQPWDDREAARIALRAHGWTGSR